VSQPEPTRVRRPRPLWAGLLSLVVPGLGQVYAGAWRLGAALFAVVIALQLVLGLLTRLTAPEPPAVAIFMVIGMAGIVYPVAVAVAAYRLARRRVAGDPARPWYRSSWIAAIAMVATTFLVSELIAPSESSALGWRSFNIASSSSLPTLQLRDFVVADVRHPAAVAGDVILFQIPRHPDVDYIKRLIGLPGDRVQMRRGILFLNGVAVPRAAVDGVEGRYRETLPNGRSYDILQKTEDGPLDNTPEFVVPAGALFVLGDNRDNSLDSRMPREFGVVPRANLVGVAYTVFWSADLSRLLLRIR
jgi:signal peptidase I